MHVDVLLETLKCEFDIVFIQEPPHQLIRSTVSTVNRRGDDVIGAPKHPDWITIVRQPDPAPISSLPKRPNELEALHKPGKDKTTSKPGGPTADASFHK